MSILKTGKGRGMVVVILLSLLLLGLILPSLNWVIVAKTVVWGIVLGLGCSLYWFLKLATLPFRRYLQEMYITEVWLFSKSVLEWMNQTKWWIVGWRLVGSGFLLFLTISIVSFARSLPARAERFAQRVPISVVGSDFSKQFEELWHIYAVEITWTGSERGELTQVRKTGAGDNTIFHTSVVTWVDMEVTFNNIDGYLKVHCEVDSGNFAVMEAMEDCDLEVWEEEISRVLRENTMTAIEEASVEPKELADVVSLALMKTWPAYDAIVEVEGVGKLPDTSRVSYITEETKANIILAEKKKPWEGYISPITLHANPN